MCSTMQSPRAIIAFSRACAARRWPAPEDADKSSTRGLLFMRGICIYATAATSVFCLAGRKFFKDAAGKPLQLAKTRQVVLKFRVHDLRFLRAELNPEDHVPELDGMRKQCV